MVVVEIQLHVRLVGGGQGRRGGKGVDEAVGLIQLRQGVQRLGGKEVCNDGPAAVAADPELELTGVPLLPDLRQIGLEGGEDGGHRRREAVMGAGGAGVDIAGPLAAIAAAPQHQGHEGAHFAVVVVALPGQRVAHVIPGLASVDVVVVETGIPEAQQLIGGGEVRLAAHRAVDPVLRDADGRSERGHDHAQRHEGQLVVVLGGRVVEQALGVVEIVGDIQIAQDAEKRQRIGAVRHGMAHRLRRSGRAGRKQQPADGRKPQRLAKIPSLHTMSSPSSVFSSISHPGIKNQRGSCILQPPRGVLS